MLRNRLSIRTPQSLIEDLTALWLDGEEKTSHEKDVAKLNTVLNAANLSALNMLCGYVWFPSSLAIRSDF
jgi:hypothetical protein